MSEYRKMVIDHWIDAVRDDLSVAETTGDGHWEGECAERLAILKDYQALEAERDELKQYVDDLLDRPTYAGEYEQLRKASHIMAENYRSLESERNRYMAALERIELMDPDWTLGVDENMSRLQSIAGRALKGDGDGH